MRRILIIASLTLALAGCGPDPLPGPTPSASTSPATSSPSPSPTGPVAPELPAAAKANTEAGAEAFVRYWFEAVTYAMQTGDTGPLEAASTPGCVACNDLQRRIKKIYGEGNRLDGTGWSTTRLQYDPRIKAPDYRFAVEGVQGRQRVITTDGQVKSTVRRDPFVLFVGATWDEGFLVFGAERIDD